MQGDAAALLSSMLYSPRVQHVNTVVYSPSNMIEYKELVDRSLVDNNEGAFSC